LGASGVDSGAGSGAGAYGGTAVQNQTATKSPRPAKLFTQAHHDSKTGRGAVPEPLSPVSPSIGRPLKNITKEFLLEAVGKVKPQFMSVDQHLSKQTHLKLHGLRLGPALDKLHFVPGVYVLYAYENQISSMRGLEQLRRLQQLYLQHNRLTNMDGVDQLVHLKKLYLGGNRLRRIEGLQACKELEEVHVSSQRLAPGVSLEFCPNSIVGIAPSLKVLTSSGNQISDVNVLGPLKNLQSLDLSNNELAMVQSASAVLAGPRLLQVWLRSNPLALNERKHRAAVVLLAPAIEEIDGKEVLPVEREFVRRLDQQLRRRINGNKANMVQLNLGASAGAWPEVPRLAAIHP